MLRKLPLGNVFLESFFVVFVLPKPARRQSVSEAGAFGTGSASAREHFPYLRRITLQREEHFLRPNRGRLSIPRQ